MQLSEHPSESSICFSSTHNNDFSHTTCDTLALKYSGVNLKYLGNWKPFKFLHLTAPLVANRL